MAKGILLVGPYPPPYGGIASLIVGLAPHLARNGYRVKVLSFARGPSEVLRPEDGLEVHRINATRALLDARSLATLPRTRQRIKRRNLEYVAREVITTNAVSRFLERDGIALVNAFMITSALFVPHLRARFGNRVKVVTTIFGELVERQDVIELNKPVYRSILLQSDQVCATSAYCASLARILDYDPSRVEVIYVGIDTRKFRREVSDDELASLGLPRDKRKILFVGRFHDEMGLDVVLEAIPHVLGGRSDVCFVLVGATGPLSDAAERVRESYADRVFVHQNAPFGLLPTYYAAADILLAPTRDKHACMGLSIKEAMAAGKPIITTNSGGVPEAVIDGRCGIVLDLGGRERLDPRRLVEALVRLLSNPEQARAFGQEARRRAVEIFDDRITLGQHLALVQRLVGKPEETETG